jgi:translation initiation factor IF-1
LLVWLNPFFYVRILMDAPVNTNQGDAKASPDIVQGVVMEALPDTLFRVRINGKEDTVLSYLSGKMRMHRIRVLIGDRVELKLDSYGGKARITRRV